MKITRIRENVRKRFVVHSAVVCDGSSVGVVVVKEQET